MQPNCPTINTIKSYLQVELPKAREIRGILSGVSSVRRYRLVQELLDDSDSYRDMPQLLQVVAVMDVLQIDPKTVTMRLQDSIKKDGCAMVTWMFPQPYQYALRWCDNNFYFIKDKSE